VAGGKIGVLSAVGAPRPADHRVAGNGHPRFDRAGVEMTMPASPFRVPQRSAHNTMGTSETILTRLGLQHPPQAIAKQEVIAQRTPTDFRRYFERKVIKWLGEWFRRQGYQWSAAWVRENYVGADREHLYMLLHVPRRLQGKLTRALARGWAEPEVAHLRVAGDEEDAIFYIIKQHTSQAHYALRFRVRRERHCRHNYAPVASVLGQRVSMTRNLERLVRRAHLESTLGPAGNTTAFLANDHDAGGRHAR
jgi:hypothetical protein